MVTDTLHVRYHLHCCGNHTQVTRNRLLLHQKIETDILDLLLLAIYLVVCLHDFFRQNTVLSDQCLDCLLNLVLYHAAHMHHFLVEHMKLLVEFCSH